MVVAKQLLNGYDPLHMAALGVNGVVVQTEHLSPFIEELGC